MQISIRFFTVLREITGKKEETLQFAEDKKVTVSSVLKTLAQLYGKPFSDYVYDVDTSRVKSFLQFFVNGRNSAGLDALEIELHEGDGLAIVPPVGGG
jgi:MoaD family protein